MYSTAVCYSADISAIWDECPDLVVLWQYLHEAAQLLRANVVVVAVQNHLHDVLVGAAHISFNVKILPIKPSFSVNLGHRQIFQMLLCLLSYMIIYAIQYVM